MDLLVEFLTSYGWQLTLIALAGVIILGILKYCKVFDKFEEDTRHCLYLLISVGLSIIGSVIYLACIGQLDAEFVFTFATAVFGVNQIAYTIYDTTPLRDLLKKVWEVILAFFSSKKDDDEDTGETGGGETEEPDTGEDGGSEEEEPVTLTEPTLVPVPTAVTEFTYNGEVRVALASTDIYTVYGGSAVDAGTYTATVTLNDTENYQWATEFDGTITFTIKKAVYNMSAVTFDDAEFTYDGKTHSIVIGGTLPTGVVVSYENNNRVNVGTYEVIASFIGDSENYGEIESLTATLTIVKAYPTVIPEVNTTRTIYTTSDFPVISLGEGSTEGTIAWEEGQTLVAGTNAYSWKFTPADTNNYKTVVDSYSLTVVEPTENNISNTISFDNNAVEELEVHLPALGKATFNIAGTSSYTISMKANYSVGSGSVLELVYYIDGGSYLPMVDEYADDFNIDKQDSYFIIDCTPDCYYYKNLLEKKWSADNVTFSNDLYKDFTYKMIVTSAEGKSVTVYLEQD